MRIGHGYDAHRVAEGERCILGGVEIPCSFGPVGHSDADVLIHAICDALLGAAALGDIGQHFPDSDPAYKGIDSKVLLKNVCNLLNEKGYAIGNVDAILCMQKPKVASYIPLMRQTLAEVMGIDVDDVSVKATTTEHLGFEGREEGISAIANVLITRQ